MPICNKITKEQIREINEHLQEEEKDFYKRDDAKSCPDKDFWEVLDEGLEKIENSPTKHLMFAHADYHDDESKETFLIKRNGKLVEVPFNELTIEEEEMIAHSSMGTTSETLECRKQGLPDYKISDETRNAINDNIMEKFGMSLDEFTELDLDEQHKLIEKYHGKKMEPDSYIWIGDVPYKGFITREEIDERLQGMDKAILEAGQKPKIFKKRKNKFHL